MEEIQEGRIVYHELGNYGVQILKTNEIVEACPSGNVKKKKNILVGDQVKIKKSYDQYVIGEVLERKNELIRPPVANISQMIIVLSLSHPSPDYMLLDKELILCFAKRIKPVIVVNKMDYLEQDETLSLEIDYIYKVYQKMNIPCVFTSVKNKTGIQELKELLSGEVSAFSGNSGVGKSSIIKEMISEQDIQIGDIGKKTGHGKHTTKHIRLYEINNTSFILDTPGFSSYELYDISYKDLKEYYPDFKEYHCDFKDCNHVTEGENVCAIKRKVALDEVFQKRYERYVYLYQKLKEMEDKKYKK